MKDPDLRRYRLLIEYDGTPFRGWQLQKERPTVQGEVEAVLERLTEKRRPVVASGRTDTGVHAFGQVASVDVPEKWDAPSLRKAMNALLPMEIRIREIRRVPGDFHPRYHATLRTYEYYVGLVEDAASPFHRRWCWPLLDDPLDETLLHRAAEGIPGERSFASFGKAGQPERGERCRVQEAVWEPWAELGLRFRIGANRYLHHMVRYLVGTMVDVARRARPLDEMIELLEKPDTKLVTSPPAPPEGLFLSRVDYPRERLGDDPDRDPEDPEPSSQRNP